MYIPNVFRIFAKLYDSMQDTFKQIYEIAIEELPLRIHNFQNEDCILYKGFRISKDKKGVYSWRDIRYDGYYEVVDPNITQKILENGFVFTISEVMLHSDKEKVLQFRREIEKIDSLISHWSKKSTSLWNEYNKKTKNNEENKHELTAEKLQALKKSYERKKDLYHKRRRVLQEEREVLREDLDFFEARIKMYNN